MGIMVRIFLIMGNAGFIPSAVVLFAPISPPSLLHAIAQTVLPAVA